MNTSVQVVPLIPISILYSFGFLMASLLSYSLSRIFWIYIRLSWPYSGYFNIFCYCMCRFDLYVTSKFSSDDLLDRYLGLPIEALFWLACLSTLKKDIEDSSFCESFESPWDEKLEYSSLNLTFSCINSSRLIMKSKSYCSSISLYSESWEKW